MIRIKDTFPLLFAGMRRACSRGAMLKEVVPVINSSYYLIGLVILRGDIFLDVCRYEIKCINCMKPTVIGSTGRACGRAR